MRIARTDLLIRKARILSQQTDYEEKEFGVQQEFFIQSLNNCNEEINKLLVAEMAQPFATYKEISTVAAQEAYPLPKDRFSTNMVYSIEFSPNGNAENYFELESSYRREALVPGEAYQVLIDGDYFYPYPVPADANGKFRIRYEKRLDSLDIPRAIVGSVETAEPSPQLELIQFNFSDRIIVNPYGFIDDSAIDPENIWEFANIESQFGGLRYTNFRNPLRVGVTDPIYDPDQSTLLAALPIDEDTGEESDVLITDIDDAIDQNLSIGPVYLTLGYNGTCFSPLPWHFESIFINWMVDDVKLHLSGADRDQVASKLGAQIIKVAEIFSQSPVGKRAIPETREDYDGF